MATLYLERFRPIGILAGTFGTLYLDLGFKRGRLCTTLEPNEASNLLIPEGVYKFSVSMSPKFRRNLPLLEVDGRSGIRIHAGNTIDDTSGCILVGVHSANNQLYYSRLALNYLLEVIKAYKIHELQIVYHNDTISKI